MLTKLRAPDGHTGITIGGVPIRVEDGAAHVPAELVPTLRSHGYMDWLQPAPDPIEEAVGLFRAYLKSLSPEEVERALAHYRARARGDGLSAGDEALQPPEAPPPGFDPARVRVEELDTLKRMELFAVLKHKGVQAVPPITNDRLRDITRDALSRA